MQYRPPPAPQNTSPSTICRIKTATPAFDELRLLDARDHLQTPAAACALLDLDPEHAFSGVVPSSYGYLWAPGSVLTLSGPALELQDVGSGAALGWSWLIAPHAWSFLGRAQTAAGLVEFDGPAVLAHCEEDPRFGYAVLKRFAALMSERLMFARRKMMEAWNPPGFA